MGYDDLRYDDVRQKSIHNTFQRIEGIYDQIVYWRVRSLEADIHTSHVFDDPDTGGDFDEWFVFHHTFDMSSSVHTLDDFLRVCAGAHRALPEHEVITLFLDIKDGFPARITSPHSRARFDALVRVDGFTAWAPGPVQLQTHAERGVFLETWEEVTEQTILLYQVVR